jgi:quinol monooxygenase YgiN
MMYGTIARARIKPGNEQAVVDVLRAFEWADVPGTVAVHVYQMDADPLEYYVVVLFSSREAYWANANSPAQHQRYLDLTALLESPPEWHDGAVTHILENRI